MKNVVYGLAALSLLAAVGCGPDPTKNSTAPAGQAPTLQPFTPVAEAGIRRDPADPTALIEAEKNRPFGVRPNPFALAADEVAFDKSQAVASLVEGQGWYSFVATEREEAEPAPVEVEPQPSRRLAGILIGETITALIDMGDGKGLQSIRPGQKIDGTEWVVQSIDEEKAILRREGSEKRPKFVVVRLEDASTMGGGGGQQGGNQRRGGGGQTQDAGRPRDE